MSEFKSLIIPFLMGGAIISTVKFTAIHIKNPALSAIIGGLPIGLISVYFLSSEKSISYAENYFYVTLSLATAIMVFYSLHNHTKLEKNVVLLISLIVWAILVFIRYELSNVKK